MGCDLASVIGRQRHDQPVQKPPPAAGAFLKSRSIWGVSQTQENLWPIRAWSGCFPIEAECPALFFAQVASRSDPEFVQSGLKRGRNPHRSAP